MQIRTLPITTFILLLIWSSFVWAGPTIDLSGPLPTPAENTLGMGGKNPSGVEINANTQYLTLNGKPWTPVMGEFHYMRYPRADWDQEMRKMKAGGVTMLSTYVIWIYHEETQGRFDWSDNKDLGAFIAACARNDLKVALRIGPWVHSEARNGGIPDWVIQKCGRGVRSQDAQFMDLTKAFYQEIFKQVKGQFWKDGGPIVAVQVDNESTNVPYLLALKSMAQEIGFQAPLYTITAWDHVRPPDTGLVPMFGGYADGFWYNDKGIPAKGRTHYFFTPIRDDSEIQLASLTPTRNSPDLTYINKFPFLTCEIGGGMAMSYARRPLMSWQDITASALTQFGAGSNLLGYYMYHGGAHPLGSKGQGLQEQQDSLTTNYNDMPPIHYDFQAPIGQYGQVRPAYHSLALLHYFIADFGEDLAMMPAVFPEEMPKSVSDATTLRWTVRTNGQRGYIFINNYDRGMELPARNEQLNLKLKAGSLTIPATGSVQIPANTFLIWPFNLDLNGALLKYATAQLVCRLEDSGVPVFVFFAPGDGKAEFAIDDKTPITLAEGSLSDVQSKDGRASKILLLSQDQAMHLYRPTLAGQPRIVLSNADLSFEGNRITAATRNPADVSLFCFPRGGLFPATAGSAVSQQGVFAKYKASVPAKTVAIQVTKVKEAGPARAIVFGPTRRPPSPTEPVDADFDAAGVWHISVPSDAMTGLSDLIVKVDYVGDCCRAYVGNRYVDDDFYFGEPWEIGVKRFMPAITETGLTIKALPLRKDSPIYVEPNKRPAFGDRSELLDVRSITAEPIYQLTIQTGS